MEILYTRSLNRNYINFLPDQEPEADSYEMRMLLSGEARCLLPCVLTKMDSCTSLSFDISSLKPVSSLADRGPLREEDIRRFLTALRNAFRSMTDCLLDTARVPLHPEYLFFREEPFAIKLCYLPGAAENPWRGLHRLMSFFLKHLDPDDAGAVLLTYRLCRLSSAPDSSPEALLQEFSSGGSGFAASSAERSGNPFLTDFPDLPKNFDEQQEEALPARGIQDFSCEVPRSRYTEADQRDSSRFTEADQRYGSRFAGADQNDGSRFEEDDSPSSRSRRLTFFALFLLCGVIAAALAYFSFTNEFSSLYVLASACIFGLAFLLLGGFLFLRHWKKRRSSKSTDPPGQTLSSSAAARTHTASYTPNTSYAQNAEYAPYSAAGTAIAEGIRSAAGTVIAEGIRSAAGTASAEGIRSAAGTTIAEGVLPSKTGSAFPEKKGTTLLGTSSGLRPTLLPAPGFWQPAVCLPEQTVLLGTAPGPSGIVIRDDTVSRMHAKIHFSEDGYYLEDLNSTNGTFLNETAVLGKEKKKLRDGDRVRFAALEYVFCYR